MKNKLKIIKNNQVQKWVSFSKFKFYVNFQKYFEKKLFPINNLKEYFLKFYKKKNNVELLKPLNMEKKSNEGAMIPRPSFYIQPEMSFCLEKIMQNLVKEIFEKIDFQNREELGLAIAEIFVYDQNFGFKYDNYYPIMQHILVSVFGNITFPVTVLKKITKNLIDYSSFSPEFQGPLPIIEAVSTYKLLFPLIKEHKEIIKIYAQNHKHPLFNGKYQELSYKLIGQKNSDIIVEVYSSPSKDVLIKIATFDIKCKTNPIENVGIFKGAICPTISYNKEEYIKKINNILSYAITSKKKLLNQNQINELEKLNNDLREIYNSKESLKVERFLKRLEDTVVDPKIESIIFTIYGEIDSDMNKKLNIDESAYEKKIPELPLNTHQLFPKHGKISNKDWIITIKKYISPYDTLANDNIKLIEFPPC